MILLSSDPSHPMVYSICMADDNISMTNNVPDQVVSDEISALKQRIADSTAPDDLKQKLDREIRLLERAAQTQNYSEAYERTTKYIDWATQVPWEVTTEDTLDLEQAKQIFEKHHYGMQSVKDRILEYIAILKFQKQQAEQAAQSDTLERGQIRAPIVLLVGLVGTGKTTFAYSIAEAMGREIVRIPFGGMGSARDLRGQSRLHLEAEPGWVVKGLVEAKTRNPVMLLDEIDRVAEDARMDIMGVLVELLDPKQNYAFIDHYLDYPVDLSQVLFIATANNTRSIATAVMDRVERIDMPSYSDDEKTVIAQRYVMPKLLQEAGMDANSLIIAEDVWPTMVRPLGFDAGIRTLERNLKGAVAKAARLRLEKNLPQVVINQDNVKFFLPTY
jgi:ATP-dependent Lon protease